MAGLPARPIILLFLYLSSLASSSARLNALQLSPHFDSFVLFGYIQPFNPKEMMSYRLQLAVELGNDVWLQNVESSYYTFPLPTRNYSGMVGRLSLRSSDECVTTLWNQSFSVQSDVGAFRLDIIDSGKTLRSLAENFQAASNPSNARIGIYSERTISNMVGVARELEGRTVIGFDKLKSKQARFKQLSEGLRQTDEKEATCPFSVASPEYNPDHLFRERKFNGELSKRLTENPQLPHVPYPLQMVSFATTIQKGYLAFLVVCFTFIQLLISLLHKSILLLEVPLLAGHQLAVGEVLRDKNTDPRAWQLCLTSSEHNRGYLFDAESAQNLKHAGKTSLEKAWHVAEQYLNEAIENDCRGVYFSYNCTTPQQETPETALGRWNRDNAGRLIRQLWP